MTSSNSSAFTIEGFTTSPYPCSYLPQMQARSLIAVIEHKNVANHYDQLIKHGFRRSGTHIYRPECKGCNQCKSVRIKVKDFIPNRSQKRTLKKGQDTSFALQGLVMHEDQFELYHTYQALRHTPESTVNLDNRESSRQEYEQFLLNGHARSQMMVIHDSSLGLKAVSVIDLVEDGVSAVYSYYQPQKELAYGTLVILYLIEYAKSLNLEYLYLGYWIADSKKMAYKSHFTALEIFENGVWKPFVAAK